MTSEERSPQSRQQTGPPDGERDGAEAAAPAGVKRLTSISADLLRGPRRAVQLTTAAVIIVVGAFFAWASMASLEEVTVGQGSVIPASRIQVVQNLEGGIVQDIMTREGAVVHRNDVLFRIDSTGFGSTLDEKQEELAGLRAAAARLEAEANGTEPTFPEDLRENYPEVVARERALYRNRRDELQASTEALRQQVEQKRLEIEGFRNQIEFNSANLELAQEELALTRPSVREGITSRVEMIRLQMRVNELEAAVTENRVALSRAESALSEARQRLTERESNFRATAQQQLNTARTQIASLRHEITAYRDRVNRRAVRSPVNGIIKQVHVTTRGQVVSPGMDLAEIVPIEDNLLIEARIRPSDVAFLRPGQQAVVKVTAYDFTVYGTLSGTLERISADTVEDEEGNTFYKIYVRTDSTSLQRSGEELPIIPGMVVEVNILTGRKTVLQYLLKPLRRMQQEALRER